MLPRPLLAYSKVQRKMTSMWPILLFDSLDEVGVRATGHSDCANANVWVNYDQFHYRHTIYCECTQPPISAHVCCGQTAGCIKIPLGAEVGLGPYHIVLDGDLYSFPLPERGTAAPSSFRLISAETVVATVALSATAQRLLKFRFLNGQMG